MLDIWVIFLIWMIGIMVSVSLSSFISAVTECSLAPLFKCQVHMFSFFGFTSLKTDTGWKRTFHNFSPICQNLVVTKPGEGNAEKREKIFAFTYSFISLMICVGITVACLGFFKNEPHVYVDHIVMSICVGMLFMRLMHFVMAIRIITTADKRLSGVVRQYGKRIMVGVPYRDLNMQPLENLNFSNATKSEQLFYNMIYLYYLLDNERMEEVFTLTDQMELMVRDMGYTVQLTPIHYWLVYYYSVMVNNEELAKKYADGIWSVLMADEDSNAQRTLSAYYFGVARDKEKAMECFRKAKDGLPKIKYESERELEAKILAQYENGLMGMGNL